MINLKGWSLRECKQKVLMGGEMGWAGGCSKGMGMPKAAMRVSWSLWRERCAAAAATADQPCRDRSVKHIHYSSLISHLSSLITHYALLITHYSFLITHYSSPSAGRTHRQRLLATRSSTCSPDWITVRTASALALVQAPPLPRQSRVASWRGLCFA
jgi:hypothetical protein